jgi:hypothetical protein
MCGINPGINIKNIVLLGLHLLIKHSDIETGTKT